MDIYMAFDNMTQAMEEDLASITNLKTENRKLTDQVALYANWLSTKETDNVALQTEMKKLHGEVKTSRQNFPPSRGQATTAAP